MLAGVNPSDVIEISDNEYEEIEEESLDSGESDEEWEKEIPSKARLHHWIKMKKISGATPKRKTQKPKRGGGGRGGHQGNFLAPVAKTRAKKPVVVVPKLPKVLVPTIFKIKPSMEIVKPTRTIRPTTLWRMKKMGQRDVDEISI